MQHIGAKTGQEGSTWWDKQQGRADGNAKGMYRVDEKDGVEEVELADVPSACPRCMQHLAH